MIIKPSRFKDGEWGIEADSLEDLTGEFVEVQTSKGARYIARVLKQIWSGKSRYSDKDVALYKVARIEDPEGECPTCGRPFGDIKITASSEDWEREDEPPPARRKSKGRRPWAANARDKPNGGNQQDIDDEIPF